MNQAEKERLAKVGKTFNAKKYIENEIKAIREQVGDRKVLLALSGGVDSSVCAALLYKAIGKQLVCVFVDHGCMRLNEGKMIKKVFKGQFGVNLIALDCEKRFLDYARVVLRLYKREEPYVLVRFPSDPTADYDYLMRAIDFAKRFCLAANFDEAAFDDLEGCVERMNSLSREAFEASPIYDFGAAYTFKDQYGNNVQAGGEFEIKFADQFTTAPYISGIQFKLTFGYFF